MMQGWLALAVTGRRQHGGNDGYADEPSSSYRWDDTVPNHRQVRVGDRIVLWDKSALIGASIIDHIEIGSTTKLQHRCPLCRKAGIKARLEFSPRFKCYKCKGEFDDPISFPRNVVTYATRHEASWVDLAGVLTGRDLRALCEKPSSQLSLRPLRWDDFVASISRAVGPMFGGRLADDPLDAHGHTTRVVRVRVGQAAFRRTLVERFGNVCAFTGPGPLQALQACHLYSYAKHGVHRDDGGLLLRSDLHTLFDLGLVGVDPSMLRLVVPSALHDYPEYRKLDGSPLRVPVDAGHAAWLRRHWEQHRFVAP